MKKFHICLSSKCGKPDSPVTPQLLKCRLFEINENGDGSLCPSNRNCAAEDDSLWPAYLTQLLFQMLFLDSRNGVQ